MKATMNKMTATTKKRYAKLEDNPATPPNPKKLANSAITAKIIAQRNIVILLNYKSIYLWNAKQGLVLLLL